MVGVYGAGDQIFGVGKALSFRDLAALPHHRGFLRFFYDVLQRAVPCPLRVETSVVSCYAYYLEEHIRILGQG